MNVSLTGVFSNMVRDYENRLERCKKLIEHLKKYEDLADDDISEHLLSGHQFLRGFQSDTFEDLEDFFNTEHNSTGIGKKLLNDIISAKEEKWADTEMFIIKTEEQKQNLKQLADMMG